MLRLMLLRHAKADRPEGVADRDRPLAGRGRKDSRELGALMVREGLLPDLALVSLARRTAETWDLVASAFARPIPLRSEPRLYDATPTAMLEVLKEVDRDVRNVVVVGHNPGLHLLARHLIGKGDPAMRARLGEGLPTAGLLVIDFDIGDWNEVDFGRGALIRFDAPLLLDGKPQ